MKRVRKEEKNKKYEKFMFTFDKMEQSRYLPNSTHAHEWECIAVEPPKSCVGGSGSNGQRPHMHAREREGCFLSYSLY